MKNYIKFGVVFIILLALFITYCSKADLEKAKPIPIIKERQRIIPLTKEGYSMNPIFSFDESKVYFIMDPQSSSGYSPSRLSLYEIDVNGNNQKLILKGCGWDRPSISKDGKKLITAGINIDLTTGKYTQLKHNLPSPSRYSFSIVNSCISPDGKSFAFSSYDYNQGIYCVDINLGKANVITKEKVFMPSYLSNGDKISFIGKGNFDDSQDWGKTIEIVGINGKDREIIFSASEDQIIYSQFCTKNDNIIFISYDEGFRTKRYKINIDGSNLEQLNDIEISDITKDNKLAVCILDNKVCLYQMDSKDYNQEDLIQALSTFVEVH